LLEENENFGMQYDQITLMKQEKVPALENNQAHFARNGTFDIQTKPHGHGDVHSLMAKSRLYSRWMMDMGVRWTFFFQDTNAVSFRSFIAALGVSKKYNFAMNSITIPRLPGQAVGGIADLTNKKTGDKMTINVEYNQLGPLLLSTGECKGDVADASGFSPFPGNTNSFILDHNVYWKILEQTNGAIPEFVNPKYTDETKTKFKKPTRLECMMQEYPKLLSSDQAVGITQLPTWLAMSPVKNNIKDALVKFQKVGCADCASSGEANMYFANRQYMREAGVKLAEGKPVVFEGIPVPNGAHIVYKASFAVCLADVKKKCTGGKKIQISKRSTLILEGDITLKKLELDGALHLKAAPGAKVVIDGLVVKNNGAEFSRINVDDQSFEEKYRIRGYNLKVQDMKVMEFTKNVTVKN